MRKNPIPLTCKYARAFIANTLHLTCSQLRQPTEFLSFFSKTRSISLSSSLLPPSPSKAHVVILAENLTKTFRDRKRGLVRAVDRVSFKCEPGQIFGLLGANGAGKTTILRMLGTLLEPTQGHASVAGFDIKKHPQEVRRHIGFLSNGTALYGRLTAREMLEYFGRLNALEGKELSTRVDALIERLEIGEFQHGRCDKLSTGQKQRVSIARSIIHRPPVMVFDEPTTGLDIMTSQTVMGFIEECRDEGLTVVYSTHIMSEVERLCDKVAIVHRGRIVAENTVSGLREESGEQTMEKAFLKIVSAIENERPSNA